MRIWWRKLKVKPKVLIATLTSCSGCIGTISALDIFPEFLERVELVYFPFLIDQDEIQDSDIALVEGCVSQESQVDLLKTIRKKAKKLIALGTCACFGGIMGLSTEKLAEPISNYVDIDGMIPGCPPPPKLLGNSLMRLLEDKEIELPRRNLCASCPLRGDLERLGKREIDHILPEKYHGGDERTRCFLNDHILCLGPITREGCECRCIEYGMPCEGCMGPIEQDFTSNLINFLSMMKLSKDLRKYEGLFFRFARPKIKGMKK
jgi:F420-non-reducing hydrogenase small subunit